MSDNKTWMTDEVAEAGWMAVPNHLLRHWKWMSHKMPERCSLSSLSVLIAICSFARNGQPTVIVGDRTLAGQLGVHRVTIHKHRRILVTSGLILQIGNGEYDLTPLFGMLLAADEASKILVDSERQWVTAGYQLPSSSTLLPPAVAGKPPTVETPAVELISAEDKLRAEQEAHRATTRKEIAAAIKHMEEDERRMAERKAIGLAARKHLEEEDLRQSKIS